MRDILEEIAASTAGSIGREFLAALVKSMQHALEAKLVFITIGIGTPPRRARSVACWREDGDEAPLEYDLEGTPCRLVYDGETIVVSQGVYRQYEKEKSYDGYLGVPLRGGPGKIHGHFAVLTTTPLKAPDEALAILRLFALRAEAEIARMAHEREREALIASLSRANRRLSGRQYALRQSNETKSQLLHMVAHDLRNPLSVILGRAELVETLGGGAFDASRLAKIRESGTAILETAERMNRMIGSALALAREEAAQLPLELHEFPAVRALETAIALNRAAADRKSISVQYACADGMAIAGDEDRIIEALDNLMSNAVKYSAHGQSVEAAVETAPGVVSFTVRDHGQGLTPDDCARAFRQFERLSAKPTGGESSTGLGLSIVRAIAEAHGGSATVESEGPGRGAVFSITLPSAFA
jgi:signal transduction histidine kinase